MKQFITILFTGFFPMLIEAQNKDTVLPNRYIPTIGTENTGIVDRVGQVTVQLKDVTVEAFHSNQHWKAVPAALATINEFEFNRYTTTSFIPVFNTISGVRIEERSPASYRLSIRGSLLRSPFGVRNVKVYWNGIPLSDGGGNTYLNLVDMNTLTGAEVIKGPAASVYGAGTGGAVLLHSAQYHTDSVENHFTAGVSGGSYGLFQEQAGWQHTTKTFSSSLQQVHQQSDGYREQSATRKDVLKWQGNVSLKDQSFRFLVFYTDLYYQTPGGITLAQFQQDPRLSRQAAGALPGAIQQKAAIYNKTIFGGVHHTAELDEHFTLQTFVTANHTNFTNPFITNYEIRGESNVGAGTSLQYRAGKFQWITGAEWLANHSLISDYGNRSGVRDTVQFKDDIYAAQWFAFTQAQLNIGHRWILTGGLSLNNQAFRYKRLTDASPVFTNKNISLVLTPRLALLYKLTKDVSLYALVAKGFSPPAVAEVRPSDGKYHGDLGAEYGWNYEAGIKGEAAQGRLQFDVAAYFFSLQNAIVRRTDSSGADYFVNAGGTKQNGIEALLKYQLIRNVQTFISGLHVWSSYSFQPYHFDNYQQGAVKYSGNELTGVPRSIWVSGFDLQTKPGVYLNTSINAVAKLPLTDANDAYADAYQLVQLKLGYRCSHSGKYFDISVGIDNLLDQKYSLGNDINAAGKRYYNAAAGRNLFAGVVYHF